jgi:hypothetical protein
MRACRWGKACTLPQHGLIGDWRGVLACLLTRPLSIRLQSRQLPYLSPRLTDPRPPRLVVSSGHARGTSLPLHWFKKLPFVLCSGPKEAHYRRVWRFALSAPEIRPTNRMTCGPGPPCHRLGCLGSWYSSNRISCNDSGARGRVSLNKDSGFLEKGFTPRAAVTLSHSLPITCAPLPSCSSVPRPCHRTRHGFTWSS